MINNNSLHWLWLTLGGKYIVIIFLIIISNQGFIFFKWQHAIHIHFIILIKFQGGLVPNLSLPLACLRSSWSGFQPANNSSPFLFACCNKALAYSTIPGVC